MELDVTALALRHHLGRGGAACGRRVQRRTRQQLVVRKALVAHRIGAVAIVGRTSCMVPSAVCARRRVHATFVVLLAGADDDVYGIIIARVAQRQLVSLAPGRACPHTSAAGGKLFTRPHGSLGNRRCPLPRSRVLGAAAEWGVFVVLFPCSYPMTRFSVC